MEKVFVHYGCGLTAPRQWTNFDSSPTLRIQKTPVIGALLKSSLNVKFPASVKYGDIVKGLPVKDNSCDGIFCSHVLEHLSLNDFRTALANTYKILKPGGIFRCVVPDLEVIARSYIKGLEMNKENASISFIGNNSLLGTVERPKGFKGLATNIYGNARHLWMWDKYSLAAELKNAGFIKIREAAFNDSEEPAFKLVEEKYRFTDAVSLQCSK
jgi:SAM-dependent methyltransferase